MRIVPKAKQPRFPRLACLMQDRAKARLTRLDNPATAEDDYFRLSNRGR